MKRFKNILLVVENSVEIFGSAAEKAKELVRLNNARIKIVGVMDDSVLQVLGNRLLGTGHDLKSMGVEDFHQKIKTAIIESGWSDIPLETEVLQGKPFIEIIQLVIRQGYDLVVKQNNEQEGVDNLAMRLLRKCPCPVWLIKNKDTGKFRRIMAAIDVSSSDEETIRLNSKIIELTHSLAQREGGEAHYLYTWYLYAESMLRGPRFSVDESEILSLKSEIIENGNAELNKLFGTLHIHPDANHIHILEGRPKPIIQQMIEEKDMDVLVMGTVGRTGIPGLLIGNTAESIVRDVKCSLMAVKPDGFISPVS